MKRRIFQMNTIQKMKMNNIIFCRDREPVQTPFNRSVSFDVSRADQDKNSIPVVISTETPVLCRGIQQVLEHSTKSVIMDRVVSRGMALISKHGGEVVGRVRNVALRGKELAGEMFFSRSAKGQEFFHDVIDGIITDVSVEGSILKRKIVDHIERVQLWEPVNVAFAPAGADPNARVIARDRDHGDPDGEETADEKRFIERGRKLELSRQTEIKDAFKRHMDIEGVEAIQETCITEGTDVARSRALLLDHIGTHTEKVDKTPANTFESGDTDAEKFAIGINRALSVRVGCATEEDLKDIGENQFSSYNPVEIARHYLSMIGFNTKGLSRSQIVGESFVRSVIHGSATTSDFPNILADVANKAMLKGYTETEETWMKWCMVGNLTDFKEALRVNLSEFDNLPEVPEAGEYSHGKFGDLAEKIKLLTYGKLFTISRQALINDDLSALGRIPMGMGRAGARKVGDLAYSVLTSNPIMNQDETALFHADHDNIGTPGEAPSVETIDAARVQMGLQEGPAKHATLGIRPAYGICSLQVEGVFRTLMKAQYDPAAPASNLVPNSVQGLVEVVAEHRLSRDDPEGWYLAASGSVTDTIEVAFLDGNQSPYLEQQEGFTRDGVSHKVRIDAAAAPMDYRGLWWNGGAAEE